MKINDNFVSKTSEKPNDFLEYELNRSPHVIQWICLLAGRSVT